MAGDRLHLGGPPGGSDYQVTGTRIIDSRHARIPAASSMDGLCLVTCCPFDAIVPGGPLRYVVQARRTNLNTVSHGSSSPAGTNAKASGQTL